MTIFTTEISADSPARRASRTVMAGGLLVVSIVLFSLIGQYGQAAGALAAVAIVLAGSAAALVYLLSAAGLGLLLRPLYRGLADERTAQIGLGLSLQFTLSHLLAWAGLLAGGARMAIAATPCVLGLILLVRNELRLLRPAPSADGSSPGERYWAGFVGLPLSAIPAVGLLLIAACNPPGWLWASEFGGYDALSYHLQLPQEWLASGRLAPLTHNVYSFLPGYFEAAFMHVSVLTGAQAPAPGSLLAADGRAALACQVLHALTAITAGLLVVRFTRAMILAACPADPSLDQRSRSAAAVAGGLLVATPWVIVVGSLAYNEMAMCTLFAAALSVAADAGAHHIRRWITSAWLVGVACALKPTALTFATLPVAIVLLGTTPVRSLPGAAGAAAITGLAALSPWLIRNYVASGNPVFPYLSGLFGTSHWSPEQIARYLAGHRSDLPFADRLRLLFLPDESDPAGPRHRGMLHPQWAAFFPLLGAAVGSLLCRATPLRRYAVILSLGVAAQLVVWLTTTHVQSRFLLPLAITGAPLVGLAFASLLSSRIRPPRPVLAAVTAFPILVQTAASALIFIAQHNGRPNDLLPAGPGLLSGQSFRAEFDSIGPTERAVFFDNASPEVFCNLTLAPTDTLYLLGDATPLYFTCPLIYNTTWDTPLLASAMRDHPGEPAAWTAALRARGVTHILFNPSEIDRLQRSGWYDPTLTPDAVSPWLESSATLVRSWPDQSRYLFRLR